MKRSLIIWSLAIGITAAACAPKSAPDAPAPPPAPAAAPAEKKPAK